MSTIIIQNNTYSGNSIVITNGTIFIDGKDVTPDSKEINISVVGDIEELKVDACNKVSVEGNVKSISTQSGDIEVSGDVHGSISTMSGDVDCNKVSGSVSTISGDIKHKRSYTEPFLYTTWISVSEQKPNNKDKVIVNCEHGITMAEYTKFDNGNEMWWAVLSIGTYKDSGGANQVTHWLPLPSTPSYH